jgi:molybdopterin converting factor small subunit
MVGDNMREKIPIGEKVFVYKDSPYLPLVIVGNKEVNAWDVMDTLSDKEKVLVAKAKELREALEKKDITVITQIQKEYDTLLENMKQETTIEKWQSKVNQEIAPEKVDEFSIFEKLDEQQIVEELEGKVITEYFYSFLVGGREVTGISWAGIKAVARYMSMQNAQHGLRGIEVLPIDLEKDIKETDQYIIATARAVDHGTGLSMVGISKQAKYVVRRDGTQVPDEFALVKACSKAMRNAIRALIPESIIIEMYNKWKEGENKHGN